jgi:hypothetical protein
MELGPTVAPHRVADAARLEARSTPQTAVPIWAPRRFITMNVMMRTAAAAALVGVGVYFGYGALRPDVGGVPSPTSQVTPQPLPDVSTPQSGTILNQALGTRTRVDFSIPSDGQVMVTSEAWRIDITDGSGLWGITFADVTGATNHIGRFGQEAIPASDAATFLAALDSLAAYEVSDVETTTIGGRPTLTATISLEEGVEGDHLDVNGSGGVGFDLPNATYLTDVESAIIIVQFWAQTESDFAANMPLAEAILASLRLSP